MTEYINQEDILYGKISIRGEPVYVYVEKEITNIAITTLPSKLQYIVNQSLDLSGMIITATYNDDTYKTLTSSDYTLSIEEGYTFNETGTFTETITVGELTTSFDITVVE